VTRPFAIVAEFASEAPLREALGRLLHAGFERVEIYSPYPLDGIELGGGRAVRRLPAIVFAAALAGIAVGYGMQFYLAAVDYKIDVGGRPLDAIPAFVPIAFEITVLFAVAAAVVATILLAGLPRLSHPVDAAARFARASQDRFFLSVEAGDPRFDPERLEWLMRKFDPLHVEIVHE
jgi:hypothetical protein